MNTPGRRALYNNLHKNEPLTLEVDQAVKAARPDAWRGVRAREQAVKAALLRVLHDVDEVKRIFLIIQHMKTKWGGCTPARRTIRLNTELAKKPRECLEYVLVHEMVHLLEPSHNDRFQRLMDQFMPMWRERRVDLNRAPLVHEEWGY